MTKTTSWSRRNFVARAGLGAGAAFALPAVAQTGAAAPAVAAEPGETITEANQRLLARFVDMRFGMFIHYSLGTYSNEEWATPNQSPSLFAPPSVDCAQWAAAAKAAKMQYAVLTTKHHDGFSLWPTAFGTQNVMSSGYKQDVVRQYVDAFRSQGLRVGFYFSIWDRTAPIAGFGGHTPDQTQAPDPLDMDIILGQLTELLTNYGDIDLLMTDGYTWQMGQQAINYRRIHQLVKELQPDCLLTDICAVTQPWLGDAIFWEEPLGITVPAGNIQAGVQGQTISNGWFWHPSTPTEGLMSRADILDHLAVTEPRFTSFLLNCPPNRDGRLDANIVARLAEVGQAWAGPNTARPALPAQPVKVEWPVVPVAAHASAYRATEGPYLAIDGRGDVNVETCWSTWPGTGALALPATLTLDLGGVWSDVTTFQYLPKQWRRNGTDGDVTRARVSVSTDGVTYIEVGAPTWAPDPTPKTLEWAPRDVAYVRFEVLEGRGGYSNVNGVKIGGRLTKPVRRPDLRADVPVSIVNARSGHALTGAASGVTQSARSTDQTQVWIPRPVDDGYYSLENAATGSMLTLVGTQRDPGARLELTARLRSYRQQFALTTLPDGSTVLTNRLNMLSLGIDGSVDTVGAAAALQAPDLGAAVLKWT
ncbi:alpha-L-fucosidase, partial [Rathayibacter sp. AY1A3]|uniref:alpha-L-fucosidase n=1 Tax=Rathayibacter sp. AY1A3 TaxID=2080521 RepID=UPI000CE8B97F